MGPTGPTALPTHPGDSSLTAQGQAMSRPWPSKGADYCLDAQLHSFKACPCEAKQQSWWEPPTGYRSVLARRGWRRRPSANPGRVTRKNYLYGGTLTLRDTWLACVKGRDTEEWTGETIFDTEACARAPAQSMYVQGSACTYSGDLDPSHVSPACQAEENVVCNFKCMTTQLSHCCHLISRSAVSDTGVYSSVRVELGRCHGRTS